MLLKKHKYLAAVPPMLTNALIVPFVLVNVYNLDGTYWYFALTVFIGEFISCGVLGILLQKALSKRNLKNNI